MHHHHIYDFFNNASVAGIITVALGGLAGLFIYRNQKDIDRQYSAQEKVGEALMLLVEHCKVVNQSLHRLTKTFAMVVKSNDKERMDRFMDESLPYETKIFVEALMYKIPDDMSKIESMIALYFNDNECLKNAHKEIFIKLKAWHDFIGENGFASGAFPITKQVPDVPELSLDGLTDSVKEFISIMKSHS